MVSFDATRAHRIGKRGGGEEFYEQLRIPQSNDRVGPSLASYIAGPRPRWKSPAHTEPQEEGISAHNWSCKANATLAFCLLLELLFAKVYQSDAPGLSFTRCGPMLRCAILLLFFFLSFTFFAGNVFSRYLPCIHSSSFILSGCVGEGGMGLCGIWLWQVRIFSHNVAAANWEKNRTCDVILMLKNNFVQIHLKLIKTLVTFQVFREII